MSKHTGGAKVKAGFYWNLRKWEMVTLSGSGGKLPGNREDRYLRVPVVAALFIAPAMGGLYALFLPFIGFVMVLAFLGQKAGAAGRAAVVRIGGVVKPWWRPGEAHLAGRRGKNGTQGSGPAQAEGPQGPAG